LNFNIAPRSTNALLSWPLFAQNFQLTQSPFLIPAAWNPAAVLYSTNASNITATVPITSSSEFFRLQAF
jgi:hypothetical protein